MAADARKTAVDALSAIDKGAYSELYLASAIKKAGLDRRDAALCTAICAGVLKNRALLDFRIAAYSSVKLKKIAPNILNILRAAACQIYFLDRVPDSAAVNAAVEQTRKSGNVKSTGFVNAILRRMSREKENPPEPDKKDYVNYLSVRYSHPEFLVKYFISRVGEEETEKLLQANNTPAPIVARVNTLLSDCEKVKASLEAQEVEVNLHPFLPDALVLSRTGSVDALEAYASGAMTIQDSASQLCARALAPTAGAKMLDMCASPGGKSFACAALMENRGEIVACDIHEHRVKLIKDGAERLGVKIVSARQADGTVFNPAWENKFDYVLLDAPCSGIGVIRRKSEIRYKTPESLSELSPVQRQLISCAARYVKKGGVLVYSTCTLMKEENEDVFTEFLKNSGEFAPVDFTLPGGFASSDGMLTLWPQRSGTDGFFIAKARKLPDAESARS